MGRLSIYDDAVDTGAVRIRDALLVPVERVEAKKVKTKPTKSPSAAVTDVRWTVREDGHVVSTGLTYDEACKVWARSRGNATLSKDA